MHASESDVPQIEAMLTHLRECELDLTVFQKHNDGIPVIPIF